MKEMSLEMSDGFSIYAYVMEPKGVPVGHLHILHGMAEHSRRYVEFAQEFVNKGYVVSSHDHRGHGRTSRINGIQGYIAEHSGFDRMIDDAFEIVTFFQNTYSTPKFTLFGHSMGSFIGRRYIQKYGERIDCAVFSGTGGDPGFARHGGKALAQVLGRTHGFDKPNELLDTIVFGGFNRKIDQPLTKFDWLSKNPEVIESYVKDKYCGFISTTQFFSDLFDGLGIIHKKKEIVKIRKTLPILLFSGTKDPVGNYGKAVWSVAKAYDHAGIEDVTVMLYDESRHEVVNDTNSGEVFQMMWEWMNNRC